MDIKNKLNLKDNPFKEYRRDGWPYCPRCEQDELYTLLNANNNSHPNGVTIQERIDAGVKCYYCDWSYKH